MDSPSPEDPPPTGPTGEKPFKRDNSTEQPPKDERIVSANPCPPDAANRRPSRDATEQPQSSETAYGDLTITPPINAFASNEQFVSYGGYGSGAWDGYAQYLHAADGLHMPPVIYNDNPSIMLHSGYGFNPEIAYGQYSPVATPLPSVMLDGQLYSPHQIPFSPFYQQPATPNVPSSAPLSPSELMASESNSENLHFGPGSGYFVHFGSFGGGNNSHMPGSGPLTSPSAYPQPMGILGPYEQHSDQISQQRSLHGYGSAFTSSMGNFHAGSYQSSNFGSNTVAYPSANDRLRPGVDKGRRRERGQEYSSSESLGFDRNRGPRALKVKGKIPTEQNSTGSNCKDDSSRSGIPLDLYNRPDFTINYENAKFFIIKSFSEDNVHKSIKYKVWASTPHGNKKLDAAYHKAKEIERNCPVFLFFSVNASGQFCGVAEMTGPVDFDKNADHWQHDRWSGQFPVWWHIIKDVPNSRFRHILLENNDNKPVTHSRDSQEVKLEHGVEMLKIFRDYDAVTSILDDFDFYNHQERTLKERKAKPQDGSPADASTLLANETVNQLSAAFAGTLKVDGDFEDTVASGTSFTVATNSRSDVVSSEVYAPAVKPANESEALVSCAQDSVKRFAAAELDGDWIKSMDDKNS